MTGRTVSLWLEAAAQHLIEDAIVGCQDVTAHFTTETGKAVVIAIERTPVRTRARGQLSVVSDGIWIHTEDSDTSAGGAPLKFEKTCAYGDRAALVGALAQFLQTELEGQSVVDLDMEGTDGDRNTCFRATVYSDDGVSFTTGATTYSEPAEVGAE